MRLRISSQTKRQGRLLLKRAFRALFQHPVYQAKSGLARGFRVTGDLGFLGKSMTRRNRFLARLNFAQQTVYDIGSYIGVTTLFFSKAVGPAGRVISIEPNPETFALLCKNVEMNGVTNVQLCPVRLHKKRAKLDVAFSGPDDVWGEVVGPAESATAPGNPRKTQVIPMEVYPLDDYVEAHALPPPHFIKMDTEGYEFDVLLGMQKVLREHKPSLLVEIHGDTQMRLHNLRGVIELLLALGYDVREMHSGRRLAAVNQIRRPRHVYCRPQGRADQASAPVAPSAEQSPRGVSSRGNKVVQELRRIAHWFVGLG